MSGRMNWGRVRMETLAVHRGSEWVEPEANTANTTSEEIGNRKKARIKQKLKARRTLAIKSLDPNCTCGKPKSFTGLHRLSCRP